MVVNKNEEPADYLKFLRGSTPEQDLLYQDMLIPVTSFFRDKKTFENLCNNVFPAIVKNKIPGEITRIWVAGCSTGQEVYSFAICFKEFLGDNLERLQIFGTDLSEPAITKARTGVYEKNELVSVSPQRLKDLPNVPTFKEVGLEPVNRMAYYGILGPKNLPKDVVDKVAAAVKKSVEDPAVRKRIEDTGSLIVANTPEQFAAQIKAEFEVYKQVVVKQKLTLD